MRVIVKLFAGLKTYAPVEGLPGTPFEIELPEGSTLQDVVTYLNLPEEEVKIAFVNGIIQEMDSVLKSGDEIGIFPPVGGG